MYQPRKQKELASLAANPPQGLCVVPSATDAADEVTVLITAEQARGTLTVQLPERYPIQPPAVSFRPPVPFHPNIDRAGNICLDLLKEGRGWRPNIGLAALLTSVRILLDNPNIDDPLNLEAAELFRSNRSLYHQKNIDLSIDTTHQKPRALSLSSSLPPS